MKRPFGRPPKNLPGDTVVSVYTGLPVKYYQALKSYWHEMGSSFATEVRKLLIQYAKEHKLLKTKD